MRINSWFIRDLSNVVTMPHTGTAILLLLMLLLSYRSHSDIFPDVVILYAVFIVDNSYYISDVRCE